MKTGLDRAVEYFGSKAELARALNTSPQNVNNWYRKGLPAAQAAEIAKVSNHDLSFWDVFDPSEKHAIQNNS